MQAVGNVKVSAQKDIEQQIPSLRALLADLRKGRVKNLYLADENEVKIAIATPKARNNLVHTKDGYTYLTPEDLAKMATYPQRIFLYKLGNNDEWYCPLTSQELRKHLIAYKT